MRFRDNQYALEAHSRLMEDLTIGDGIHGIKEMKQEPMNMESLTPASRLASRFSDQKDLNVP